MILVDVRNKYETSIGKFSSALDPETDNFTEFKLFIEKQLSNKKKNKIATYCTGGIRCEKATSYMRDIGFENIFQLKGGILNYLNQRKETDNTTWQGECFVFDRRVAVNHELLPGEYKLCHACGMPLSPKQIESLNYIHGIQCCYCKTKFTDLDRARFAERQRQYDNCSRKNKEKNRRNKKNDF